ncbi:MAG: SDR family oxidoreductase [Chloroflexi bacterium]|nr:SDR family oxidoreductase [Chloroflexota bacterium]
MDLGLQDKVALVVASSTGLGLAAARQLALEGAKVALCGRSAQKLAEAEAALKAEIGSETATSAGSASRIASFTCDVTDKTQIDRLVADVVAHFGGLDILITNAGGPAGGTFDTTGLDAWQHAIDLTLMSVVHLVKAALPHLRHSAAASILTITSISVKEPIGGLLLSNVLRPGVVGLTKALSQELAAENIRVNSILPGWTATERVNHIFEYRASVSGATADFERDKITSAIPMGRMAEPAEFGNVAAFLVSPAASYVTGLMMQVDGGSYSGLL